MCSNRTHIKKIALPAYAKGEFKRKQWMIEIIVLVYHQNNIPKNNWNQEKEERRSKSLNETKFWGMPLFYAASNKNLLENISLDCRDIRKQSMYPLLTSACVTLCISPRRISLKASLILCMCVYVALLLLLMPLYFIASHIPINSIEWLKNLSRLFGHAESEHTISSRLHKDNSRQDNFRDATKHCQYY